MKGAGYRDIVISTDVPLKRDGLPYANSVEPNDPGVAVYWTDRDGEPSSMACDGWATVRENMRAIGVTIEAFRTIERANAGQILKRAYSGLKALPPPPNDALRGGFGMPEEEKQLIAHWRTILGLPAGKVTRAQLDAAFQRASKLVHPDRPGGDQHRFKLVSQAYEYGKDMVDG